MIPVISILLLCFLPRSFRFVSFFSQRRIQKKVQGQKPPINVGVLSSRRELDRINVGVLDLAVKGKKRNIYQEFGKGNI